MAKWGFALFVLINFKDQFTSSGTLFLSKEVLTVIVSTSLFISQNFISFKGSLHKTSRSEQVL